MSNLDVLVGWVEADSARETVASLLLCVMTAATLGWIVRGGLFLARHTTADVAQWWRTRRFQASARRAARTAVPTVRLAVDITVHQAPAPEPFLPSDLDPGLVLSDAYSQATEAWQDPEPLGHGDPDRALRDELAAEIASLPQWDEDCLPPRPQPAVTDLFAGPSAAEVKRAVEDLIVSARREHNRQFGGGSR